MKTQDILNKSGLVEQEILENIFLRPSVLPEVVVLINGQDFYHYRKAFDIMSDAHFNGKNVVFELDNSGIDFKRFLGELPRRKIQDACKELRELSNAIRLTEVFSKATENIDVEDIDQYVADIQRELVSKVLPTTRERTDIHALIEGFKDKQQMYQDKFANGGKIIGLSTGYEKIDDVIDGIRQEHLWVIGGYTNMGKTALSLNMAASVIKQGGRVVIYSLEMSPTDVLARLVGIYTGIASSTILKKYPHDEELVQEAFDDLIKTNLTVHSSKSTLSEIQYSMYEETMKKPVDLFVIDFIQLISVKGARSEYEMVTQSILELQQTAKRLKAPIIVLSQISNEGAKNTESSVMSFKGSGHIASASDIAIEIKRGKLTAEEYKAAIDAGESVPMNIVVCKNRHGKIGAIELMFDGRTGIFSTPKDLIGNY